jgi:hypothetical protein
MLAARLRQRRMWPGPSAREELVRRHAPGRSFADIGAMWNVNGRIAFVAEECGATSVTAVDLMAPTTAYETEHAERSSRVRFVQGDLHDGQVLEHVGEHQVVWCSGVLYHSPNPLLTLQRLRAITTELLILSTETIPEVPGVAGACVFYPGLSDADRRVHAVARPGEQAVGIDTPFEPHQSYMAWWWGISPSALRGMLRASGFQIVEEHGLPLHRTVVARTVLGQLSDTGMSTLQGPM